VPRGDLHLAAVHVVPDRVVGQVRRQLSSEPGIAERRGRLEVGGDGQAAGVGLLMPGGQCVGRDGAQVKRLERVQAAFAPGQREERADEPFLLLTRCPGPARMR